MKLPVMPPLAPMLGRGVDELPVGDYAYEPKYDGFRCIVFRDGKEVELLSRNEKPLNRYFPEIIEPIIKSVPNRVVLDGEIVIPTPNGLDFDLLTQRIHPAESRIKKLSIETPCAYVVFDILALDKKDLREEPFRARRKILEDALSDAQLPIVLTPISEDRVQADKWFEQFEGAGLDGVMAKSWDDTYKSGERILLKVKHERTADCVVGGYRVHKDGKGVGSLMLGLYDTSGQLQFVGSASGFPAKARAEIQKLLKPLVLKKMLDHPWGQWQTADKETSTVRMPGMENRWNTKKDMDWVPLKPDLVAEVAFSQLQAGYRFRHNAHFQRWRPDRDADSCTFGQLETAVPNEFEALFTK